MLLAAALLVGGCKQETDPAGLAAVAAKGYYDELIAGNAIVFVAGTHRPDSIPDGYRQQLVLNAQMMMEQQQKERGGLKRVDVANATADTARHEAMVYLTLIFGNGSQEEVVVPMVEHNGQWKMR